MNIRKLYLALFAITVGTYTVNAQQLKHEVKIVGQMKDVMWKGELFGKIDLDTISNKTNLFALGPVEYLKGEILIIDGKSYKSTVTSNTTMKVEETFQMKAPFFGYSNISKFKEHDVPANVETLKQLEDYINQISKNTSRPFMFKMSGTIEFADIHIVNLADGSKVSSPDDAHKGQVNYPIKNELVDIVGFFSTEHKAILTHHDTFMHMHLITADRKKMGHIDDLKLKKGALKLFLPAE